jgi:hypothetical protein
MRGVRCDHVRARLVTDAQIPKGPQRGRERFVLLGVRLEQTERRPPFRVLRLRRDDVLAHDHERGLLEDWPTGFDGAPGDQAAAARALGVLGLDWHVALDRPE